jgi:hypothetical protein
MSTDSPQLETVTANKKAYRPKSSRKAPAIQSAILAKRANGQSKLKIKRDLGIAYNTVTNVIDLNNFDETLQRERLASMDLIPESIRVAKHRLSQNSENMAIKVLENTIWPLNSKQGKAPDPGLTIAIQNLMQVQPNTPVKQDSAIDVTPDK